MTHSSFSSNRLTAAGVILSSLCLSGLVNKSCSHAQEAGGNQKVGASAALAPNERLSGEAETLALRLAAEGLVHEEPIVYAVLQDSLAFMKDTPTATAAEIASRAQKAFGAVSAGRAEALLLGENTISFAADLSYAGAALSDFTFDKRAFISATDRASAQIQVTSDAWFTALQDLAKNVERTGLLFRSVDEYLGMRKVEPTSSHFQSLWNGKISGRSGSEDVRLLSNLPERLVSGNTPLASELERATKILRSELREFLEKDRKALEALGSSRAEGREKTSIEFFRANHSAGIASLLGQLDGLKCLKQTSSAEAREGEISLQELDGLKDLLLIADGAASLVLFGEVDQWIARQRQISPKLLEMQWRVMREGAALPREESLSTRSEVLEVVSLLNTIFERAEKSEQSGFSIPYIKDFSRSAGARIRLMGYSRDFLDAIKVPESAVDHGVDQPRGDTLPVSLTSRYSRAIIENLSPLVDPMQIPNTLEADKLSVNYIRRSAHLSRLSRVTKEELGEVVADKTSPEVDLQEKRARQQGMEFARYLQSIAPSEYDEGVLRGGTPDIREWMVRADGVVSLLSYSSPEAQSAVAEAVQSLIGDGEALAQALVVLSEREAIAFPLASEAPLTASLGALSQYEGTLRDFAQHIAELRESVARASKLGKFKELGKTATPERMQEALLAEITAEVRAAATGKAATSSIFNGLISKPGRQRCQQLTNELRKYKEAVSSAIAAIAPLRSERYVEVSNALAAAQSLQTIPEIIEATNKDKVPLDSLIATAQQKGSPIREHISTLQAPLIMDVDFIGHALFAKRDVESLMDKLRLFLD